MVRQEYETFLTIYEQQSLSRAADILDKYQGALSKQLAKLEGELKTSLFIRSNRGLIPTDEGRRLYQHVQLQRNMWTDYQQVAKKLGEEVSGLFRIGGHSSVLIQFPDLFASLSKQFPKLDLEFEVGRSPEVTRKILNHEIDIALVANPQSYEDLVIKQLKKENVALYSKEKNPKKFITYNPELISSASIVKNLGPKKSNKLIACPDYDFAAKMARQLTGSAILPESVAKRFGLSHQLGRPYFVAKLCLIYRPDHRIHNKILKFLRGDQKKA